MLRATIVSTCSTPKGGKDFEYSITGGGRGLAWNSFLIDAPEMEKFLKDINRNWGVVAMEIVEGEKDA